MAKRQHAPWSVRMKACDMARSGLSTKEVASSLGYTYKTVKSWLQEHGAPIVRKKEVRVREVPCGEKTWTPEVQKRWREAWNNLTVESMRD